MKIEEVSKIAKALSEPKRIEILLLTTDREMCANQILEQFDITQPTLSHHLKQLTDSQVLDVKKNGKMCHYRTNKNKIKEFKEYFEIYEKK